MTAINLDVKFNGIFPASGILRFSICCEKKMNFSTDPFMVSAMLSVESSSSSFFVSSISLRKFWNKLGNLLESFELISILKLSNSAIFYISAVPKSNIIDWLLFCAISADTLLM